MAAEAQPEDAPWLAPSSRPVRPAPSRIRPGRSNLAPGVRPGASAAGTNPTATAASAPNGTLMTKMARQPTVPISAPPTVGPSAGATNSMTPASGEIERPVLLPRPSSMLMAKGTSGAATSPCRTRAATSRPASGASAHIAEATVNAMTLSR